MSDVVGKVIPIINKYDPIEIARMSNSEVARYAKDQAEQICRLKRELKQCRNELCLKCGQYVEAHKGACDGCRYRHCGEWSEYL